MIINIFTRINQETTSDLHFDLRMFSCEKSYKKFNIDVGLSIEKIPFLLLFSTAFSHNSIFGFRTSFLVFFIEEKTERVSRITINTRTERNTIS